SCLVCSQSFEKALFTRFQPVSYSSVYHDGLFFIDSPFKQHCLIEQSTGHFRSAIQRKLRSRAKTIACARDHTPNLSKSFDRWLRTVLSLMPRREAMPALERP